MFVDAGHSHPFPLIDLVCLLPFLRRDAIVLLHDVVDYMRPNAWGESFIYVGWTANKYRAKYLDGNNQIVGESSLGVIEIPEKPAVLHQNLLTLAGLPWRATPWQNSPVFPLDENDLIRLRELLLKHYAPDFANELVDKLAAQLAVYNQWALLSWHETRFFNWLFEQECATATRNGFSRNGFYRSQIRRSLFSVKIRRDWWNVSFLGLQVGSRVFADRPAWLRVKIGK
ncbi:hypothetical protein AGMMS49959_05440 [Planctomycetales bacterium]|nr:hypothetical protein AGMMS49959_05440 [Planctomycetales bacterium]